MDLTGKVVLVVEDDPSVAENNMACIKETGASVSSTDQVNAALRIVKGRAVDVVMTDFHLKDGDASELVAGLEAYEESPGVVVLGAAGEEKMKELGKYACVQEVLTKPVDRTALQKSVENVARASGQSSRLSPKLISAEERRKILDEMMDI